MQRTHRLAGSILTVFGWYCMLVGVAMGSYAAGTTVMDGGSQVLGVVYWIAASLCGVGVGLPIGRIGKRLVAENAEEVLRQDPRSPVIYLRSFDEDSADDAPTANWISVLTLGQSAGPFGVLLAQALWQVAMKTDEEWLERLFARTGPIITVGFPDEKLPRAGAARLYLGDDWQQAVADLISRAQLVILRIGDSPGLLWELREAVQRVPAQRLLLYLTFRKDRIHVWSRFRSAAMGVFAQPLPSDVGQYAFLGFGQNWTPVMFGLKWRGQVRSIDLVRSGVLPRTRPVGSQSIRAWLRAVSYGTPLAIVVLPVFLRLEALFFIVAVLGTSGVVLSWLGRLCSAWHTTQAGRYLIALSVLVVVWIAAMVGVSDSGGLYVDLTWVLGAPLLPLSLVFVPVWIFDARRVDGL